jgi:exosome complex exonuclease DIS3/RRP44
VCRETFIEKLKDESPNDRNDRAIRVAVKWYTDHLKGQPVRTVLLSDDRANREKASALGLKAVSGKGNITPERNNRLTELFLVKDYVEGIKDVPELLDIVVAPKDNDANKNEIIYEEVRISSTRAVI